MKMSSYETYKTTLYSCSCGYKTILPGNANWHKKKNTEHTLTSQSKEFVVKEDVDKMTQTYQKPSSSTQEELEQLQLTNTRLQSSLIKLASTIDDSDDELNCNGCGLIYFVEDVDIPDRGKVGRTKNTDIKKLKTRYATFASPKITCFYSTDIKKDENELKKLLRNAGCMASNNEKISNCDMAASIFLKFSRRV